MVRNIGSETIRTCQDGRFHSRSTTCVRCRACPPRSGCRLCWREHLSTGSLTMLSPLQGLWNGGAKVPFLQKYKWAGEGDSVCVDPEFFKAIFANGSKAGMVMMEQDYLCSSTSQTSRDLSVGPEWFAAMDEAAARAQVDMQLCMMNPAHALASTLIHSASNGRGTGDHVVRNAARGLPLGWSGMLLWSVGMWPSRDNIWTNSSVNVTGLNMETDPEGQTAMAVLAGGPYVRRLQCLAAREFRVSKRHSRNTPPDPTRPYRCVRAGSGRCRGCYEPLTDHAILPRGWRDAAC